MESSLGIRHRPPLGGVQAPIAEMGLAPLVGIVEARGVASLLGALDFEAHSIALECRLSGDSERVDLACCLFPGFNRVPVLPPAPPPLPHQPDPSAEAAGQRAERFLEAWRKGRVPYHIPFAWIAFDRNRESASPPVPCLSLCVDRSFFNRLLGFPLGAGMGPYPPEELRRLAEWSHGLLLEKPLAAETAGRLEACAAALEGVGHAVHLSLMLSRMPVPVKLDVRLPSDRVAAYLRAAAWEGEWEGLQAAMAKFMPWQGHIQLNLVLNPAGARNLEVEFLTMPRESPLSNRLAFLDALVEAGLCASEKAEVLVEISRHPAWTRVGDAGGSIARTWYAKIRFQGDVPIEAKAYVGFKLMGSQG